MFTINHKSRTVGLQHKDSHFVVGFKSVRMARKVMYQLHPEPTLMVVRGDEIDLTTRIQAKGVDMNLVIDSSAALFIPKFEGSSSDPMNDGGYHLHNVSEVEFMTYPFTKMLGIILPYELIDENDKEFIFRTQLIKPSMGNLDS